jgi:hypothetical protein
MKTRREVRMTYTCTIIGLIAAFAAGPNVFQNIATSSTPRPEVLYWPSPPNRPQTAVGLLYTTDLLAELARRSRQPVSVRLSEAITQQTPVVVLWTIPPLPGEDPLPRPFSAGILLGKSEPPGMPIEPLWVQQDAEDLRQLDPTTTFEDVGVMAAFPRAAFVPGRLVRIFVPLPPLAPGQVREVQRFGLIK